MSATDTIWFVADRCCAKDCAALGINGLNGAVDEGRYPRFFAQMIQDNTVGSRVDRNNP